MKRLNYIAGFLVVLSLIAVLCATQAAASQQVSLMVEDQTIYCDVPPVIVNGRVFVPLRAAVEALGGRVVWNAAEREVWMYRPPYPPIRLRVDVP